MINPFWAPSPSLLYQIVTQLFLDVSEFSQYWQFRNDKAFSLIPGFSQTNSLSLLFNYPQHTQYRYKESNHSKVFTKYQRFLLKTENVLSLRVNSILKNSLTLPDDLLEGTDFLCPAPALPQWYYPAFFAILGLWFEAFLFHLLL